MFRDQIMMPVPLQSRRVDDAEGALREGSEVGSQVRRYGAAYAHGTG